MDEPSQTPEIAKSSAFEYRIHLMGLLSKRWENYCHEYDQLAVKDWEGSKARRHELVIRMNELNAIMRDFLPWINP